jgi:ATP-dependent Clp protease ATP-binding subunit ClpX
MLEVMYDLPSRRDVKTFTVTRDLVEQRSRSNVLPIPSANGRTDHRDHGNQASA